MFGTPDLGHHSVLNLQRCFQFYYFICAIHEYKMLSYINSICKLILTVLLSVNNLNIGGKASACESIIWELKAILYKYVRQNGDCECTRMHVVCLWEVKLSFLFSPDPTLATQIDVREDLMQWPTSGEMSSFLKVCFRMKYCFWWCHNKFGLPIKLLFGFVLGWCKDLISGECSDLALWCHSILLSLETSGLDCHLTQKR